MLPPPRRDEHKKKLNNSKFSNFFQFDNLLGKPSPSNPPRSTTASFRACPKKHFDSFLKVGRRHGEGARQVVGRGDGGQDENLGIPRGWEHSVEG